MATKRDTLAAYRAKRDFTRTAEPAGKTAPGAQFRYLIQKHEATRLHYDFRLELDGTLKSWAVTKGPSLDPHDKRLAVEVEDHPVSYGDFEGTIPQGEYGGGTVMLWDTGHWEPLGDPRRQLKEGKLTFLLHGARLKGEWALVRMARREKGRSNWLLIKKDDDTAKPGDGDALLRKYETSIKTGRKMDAIAAGKKGATKAAAKPARKPAMPAKAEKSTTKKPARRGKNSPLPAFIAPQLATLGATMPQSDAWLHEVKFDGYRLLAYVQNGKAVLYTRTGQDWTRKFGSLPDHLAKLPVDNAIFDGEVVAVDAQGRSAFGLLQDRLHEAGSDELQYYVFDLLHLNGEDCRALPLLERKKKLAALLQSGKAGDRIIYSEHFTQGKKYLLAEACGLGLEGMISKLADAPYRSGRSTAWMKTKCHKRQEFVIGGYTLPKRGGRGIGALLLGYYEAGALLYAGQVGTGFSNEIGTALLKQLEKMHAAKLPFATIATAAKRGAQGVMPKLVCEVEFTEWTADGMLRHPSFQGLREDKPARDVGRDRAMPVTLETPAKKSTKKPAGKPPVAAPPALKAGDASVGGVRISHPDRVIFPGTAITKQKLAAYYEHMAPLILPHIAGRPLSMLRCPDGVGASCFFQRHGMQGRGDDLHTAMVRVKDRNEAYLMIDDIRGLLTLVQWGAIELHPWGCKTARADRADRLIIDLDPDPAVPWRVTMAAARDVKARMKLLGLESFVKTTGGKGLHVVAPLAPMHDWPTIKACAQALADAMAADNPDLYTANMSKAKRQGRIFVDYLRNELTATAVAPYTVRAREGAPVSMPLRWQDLNARLDPQAFTVASVLKRKPAADPWKGFFSLKQKIAAKYLKLLRSAA